MLTSQQLSVHGAWDGTSQDVYRYIRPKIGFAWKNFSRAELWETGPSRPRSQQFQIERPLKVLATQEEVR